MNDRPVPFDPEERIFTLEDVTGLFRKLRRRLIQIGLIAACLVFSFLLIRPLSYKIEATFKEGVEKSGSEGALRELLGGFGGAGAQPQAVTLMKSYQVLKPLAARFGLQASVLRSANPFFRLGRRIRDNWYAERGLPLPELDWFAFSHVQFDSLDSSASFQLKFQDREHFCVLEGKQCVAEGKVGAPVAIGKISFVCTKVPSALNLKKEYTLVLSPWVGAASGLKDQIKIVSHKTNKSIYDLTLLQRDRHLGTQLLNGLMEEYRHYLKTDHDQISSEQLAYLESRQSDIYGKMGDVFSEYVAYLKEEIHQDGLGGFDQEASYYTKQQETLKSQFLAIDSELERLQKEVPITVGLEGGFFATSLAKTLSELDQLKQERDLLEISLEKRGVSQGIEERLQEMAHLREQKGDLEGLFASLSNPSNTWTLPPQFAWARSAHRRDFAQYLEHHLHLLSLREKMVQERLTHPHCQLSELEGLTLETARRLHVEYLGQLDQAEAAIRQYTHLQQEIQAPQFELGSLAAVLKDPFSQGIIQRASQLDLQLKDEKHRSHKEGTRWAEEMAFEKKVLAEHLTQLRKVEELNGSLIREKINAIQQASLDCINQQISVLQESQKDAIRERIELLKDERTLLGKKIEKLKELASRFPEKWKLENWLSLKKEMGTKIMAVMTELVESKTIASHLHHVESKPLDLAMTPNLAQKPHLFRFSILGGIGAAFAVFFFALFQNLLRGFPLTPNKLIALRYPFSGKLSTFCDGPEVELLNGPDLETLRQLSLFTDRHPEAKILGLLGGKGPDYSYALASNLARSGKSVLLLRCDFPSQFQEEDRPGLLQWLEGKIEELPLRRKEGFDWIPSGGFSSFGVELLQSKRFKELLEQQKSSYDLLLLWLKAPLDTAENNALLRLSDFAVVTVSGEQTEELTPFIHWAYHEEKSRLTLICSE